MSAFKAYDIRGVYNRDFSADTVYRIGRCLPALLDAPRVLVGRDVRESSPEIFAALCRGITEAGADVDSLGLCATPMTYYFTGAKSYRAAIMITASHNPREYNGLKISRSGALPMGEDSGLRDLEKMIAGPLPPPAETPGRVNETPMLEEYLAFHRKYLPNPGEKKIVVDCSNGMAGLFARRVFGEENVIYLNETLDGTFPNHPPNPLLPEAVVQLSEAVRANGAAFGILFDGDADRVVFADEEGRFIRPDMVTGILADYYLSREPGSTVLCDIRSSRGVTEEIARRGGVPELWKVGHAFAKVKLRELHAPVGGELAGHYYFRDFYHCDSALLCAELITATAFAEKEKPFSGLFTEIDCYANSGECNYTVERKDDAIGAVLSWLKTQPQPDRMLSFDGIRCDWPDWWFNIRKSNTEPYLRLILEARTPVLLAEKKAVLETLLKPFFHAES